MLGCAWLILVAHAEVTVTIKTAPAAPGETTFASIWVENAASLAGLDLALTAPDFVTLGPAETTGTSAGFLLASHPEGSHIQIALARSDGAALADGSILRIPLRVTKTAPVGTFGLAISQVQFYSSEPARLAGKAIGGLSEVVAPSVDLNGNGIPDAWEARYFGGDLGPANRDFDQDGLSDYQEFLSGTDPAAGDSSLRIVDLRLFHGPGGASAVLEWAAEEGKSYQVQWSNGPIGPGMPWRNVYQPALHKTGSTLSWTDDGTRTYPDHSRERYYRVVVNAEPQ